MIEIKDNQAGNMVNYQERMERKHHKNNLQTQFGVVHTPKDNQMRKIIGSIPSAQFAPIFDDYLARLGVCGTNAKSA
ncbi:Uncharacterised protein [Legionella feeleii]|uniref:Uncharacterized protein n=2 Tax=Legionella feeleii TaxID=453 RepID=A0A2X1R0J1_9GAMM|nr:Uncharacterised protein [Legionella feeleii]